MVGFTRRVSLCNRNLRRVSAGPYSWPIPAPTISFAEFKILLRRRNRSLSRLKSLSNPNSQPHRDNDDDDGDYSPELKEKKENERVIKDDDVKKLAEEKKTEKNVERTEIPSDPEVELVSRVSD